MSNEQKTNETFVNPEGRIRGLEALYTKGDFYTLWRKNHKASKSAISFLNHVKRLNEIKMTPDTPFIANSKGPVQVSHLDTALQYDIMVTLVINQLTKLLTEVVSGRPIGLTSTMCLEFYNLLKINIIYLQRMLGGEDESKLLTPTTSVTDMYNTFVFLAKLEGHRPVLDNVMELNFTNKNSSLPEFIMAEGTRRHELLHGGYDAQVTEEIKELEPMLNIQDGISDTNTTGDEPTHADTLPDNKDNVSGYTRTVVSSGISELISYGGMEHVIIKKFRDEFHSNAVPTTKTMEVAYGIFTNYPELTDNEVFVMLTTEPYYEQFKSTLSTSELAVFTALRNKLDKEENTMKNETEQVTKEEASSNHTTDNTAFFDGAVLGELSKERGEGGMGDIEEGLERGNTEQSADVEDRESNFFSTPLRTLIKDIGGIDYSGEANVYSVVSELRKAKKDYKIATPDESLESLLDSLDMENDDLTDMVEKFKVFFDDTELSECECDEIVTAIEAFCRSIVTDYEAAPETIYSLVGEFLCITITALVSAYESGRLDESDILNPDKVDDDAFDSILNDYTDELKSKAETSDDGGCNRGDGGSDSGGNLGWWLLGAVAVAGVGYMAYNHWSADSEDDIELLDLDELF